MSAPAPHVNRPTVGHAMGAAGWSTAGFLAHLATVFAVPAGRGERVVLRAPFDWPDLGAPTASPWRMDWRPPNGNRRVALGCAARCPLTHIDLRPSDDFGLGGEGLAPDPQQMHELAAWVAGLQVSCECALLGDFPVLHGGGARVAVQLWLPQVWLAQGPQGCEIAAVVDRSMPISRTVDAVAAALAAPQWALAPALPAAANRSVAQWAAMFGAMPQLAKVVAATEQDWRRSEDRRHMADRARRLRPASWVVDAKTPHTDCLCATPELLARATAGRLESLALAGTRRPDGQQPAGIGAEHGSVVEFVAAALQAAGVAEVARTAGERPDGPLRHAQTQLDGPRPPQADVLAAALRLHPTPALLGLPRLAALQAVAAMESRPRGWYGGCAGVLDAAGTGNGEVVALLRGAEPNGGQWRTRAGAGLVAGCDPAAEQAEIGRKHAAIAEALGLAEPA